MTPNSTSEKFQRHYLIDGFTTLEQEKLSAARVLIIGAGGLGSPVLLYLAGAGVGNIGLVEFDLLESSNLHRQILYADHDLGSEKAELAKQRLEELNPEISINIFPEMWTPESAARIAENHDIIVDCSDNIPSRRLSDQISRQLGIPFVYGAVHQMEGQIAVFNYRGSKSYTDLFPDDQPPPPRKPIGVLGPVPGIIGSYQAAEVIKIITGIGEVLANKILYISARTNRSQIMEF